MLSKHDKCTKLLSKSLSHKSTVVVEGPNAALVTCVEEDGSCSVLGLPIGIVFDVSKRELSGARHIKMIKLHGYIEVLRVWS